MTVITVSRQFGAGGSSVAKLLAAQLRLELVDDALVTDLAARLQLSASVVQGADERPETFGDRLLGALKHLAPGMGFPWRPPGQDEAVEPRWAIVNLTQELIREAARMGNVVIVGRGGAFVLRDHPGALHVFLFAPDEDRLRTIMAKFLLNERAARRRLREVDANRAAYIRQVYAADWRDGANFDLVVNTGRLGYERAAAAIIAAANRASPSLRVLG